MKYKIIFLILILCSFYTNAQVVISEQDNPLPTNSSVLLEFDTGNRGIILPIVDSISPNTSIGGSFLVDKTTKSVVFHNGVNWVSLSKPGDLVEHNYSNSTEDNGNGVVIGAESTTKSGILVLESNNSALVLPKLANPHLSILSPIAGTICYDTVSDSLAIFDGTNWSFWK